MPGQYRVRCDMCECQYHHHGAPQMPWATPPINYYRHPPVPHYYKDPFVLSSSRQMRNQAEKQRRDKLNQFINELAMLVPMVASSAKRLDKTSILRLSATFLRMHQILNKNKEVAKQQNSQLTMPVNWCQLMLEGLDGMLLVVTSTGKIVFISHTVEALLGHSQTDLLGQTLFNITSLEDHDVLKENLTPSAEPEGLDEPSTSLMSGTESALQRKPERRSFYLRLRHKSTPRGEQPHYETVHVMGHLRVPSPPLPPSRRPAGGSSDPDTPQNMSQEVVLVAMMQPFKEKKITQFSLLEASREEWISRHLIDGTIVFSDHRISVVSGYMAEEVNGNFAFKYMHQEDVWWVLVALRQMYHYGESYGKSCYRLMSKTGEYIYIRTHGYLELNEDSNSVQSFVCINTLVTKEEGEKNIKEMKEMFTPIVKSRDSSVVPFTNCSSHSQNTSNVSDTNELLQPLMVDDPGELNTAIELLLSDLPTDKIHPRNPEAPGPDEQYVKCAMVSKTLMPPVHVHSSKVGVVTMPTVKKSARYSRPSVITRVKEKRASIDEQPLVKKLRPESSVPPISTISETNRSSGVIRSRNDYMDVVEADVCNFVGTSLPSVQYNPSPQSYVSPSPPNCHVIASPQEDQLGYLSSPSDINGSVLLDPSTSSSTTRQPVQLFLNDIISVDGLETRLPYPSISEPMDDPLQVATLDTLGLWESDVETLEEGVVRGQMQLEERIQFQDTQISAIEEDLTLVPLNSEENHIYRSTFTHLKAEHRKQQQMLRTMKEDHQSIKDQLTIRGAQDIGV